MSILGLIVLALVAFGGVKAYQECSESSNPLQQTPENPVQVPMSDDTRSETAAASADDSPADEPMAATLETLAEETSADAEVYTPDDDGFDGAASGVLAEVDSAPDFVVQDFPVYLLGVVEGADALDDGDAVERLERYAALDGYTTLLVVPDEATRTAGRELAEQVTGTVHVTAPGDLTEHL